MTLSYRRTKLACYSAYFTMSSIFSLPPLLFVTFREMYGVSYTLLGTLVLINFCTQLIVDLIFTLFSKYFNISLTIRIMPCLTSAGLAIYALIPTFFPEYAYPGLAAGTVLFSVSAGLSEVLLSPTIAAIPSENPQRDMSMLHSLYAFGVFTVVIVSTLFLNFFGYDKWMYLTIFLAVWPLLASILFFLSPIPPMESDIQTQTTSGKNRKRTIGLALCVGCIFFGSCAENAMSNWISGYIENALQIDKTLGDVLGMAMFAILLGLTRILYAKYGKNIGKMLITGMAGASLCYLIAALSGSTLPAFLAAILAGVFTAMLWPGTLILMEENVPAVGVAAYALMAAGGDLGASIAPQLMGIVIDQVSASELALGLSAAYGLTTEQIGMKAGMLVSSVFPILGTLLLAFILPYFKKQRP